MDLTLTEEEVRLSELLLGKTVKLVKRHRKKELMIEFTDSTRLFVDLSADDQLEFSVNGGTPEQGEETK